MNKKIKKKYTKPIIGQHVWIIENDLKIAEKRILAIIHDEKEDKYKLDVQSCGGISEKEFYKTEAKAEVAKQEYLDKLKFKVGELVIFKDSSYTNSAEYIGRINEVRKSGSYYIQTSWQNPTSIKESDILLKIKNSYIENFGSLKKLYKEFDEVRDLLDNKIKEINNEHAILEKELMRSFHRNYAWYRIRKTPMFEDRFKYRSDDDWE